MLWISTEQKMQTQKNRNMCGFVNIDQVGALREIRTPDPLVPNQMRYQAALHSELLNLGLTDYSSVSAVVVVRIIQSSCKCVNQNF